MLLNMAVAIFAAALAQEVAPADPRAIVRELTAAVESDRVPEARRKWEAVGIRDPANPAARLALATLARLTYDYATADSLYRRLFAAAPGDDARLSAYARLGLAEGLYEQGRLGEIDQLLVQARAEARLAGDHVAEGETLAGLARVRTLSQGVEVGLALLDTGSAVTPPEAADVRALLGCTRAQFMVVMGKPRASETLDAALTFARRRAEPKAEAVCLRALSLEHRFAGRSDSSLAVLRELEALRRRTRDRSRLAEALFLQGDVLQELSEYGKAKDVLHRALAEAQASHNLYVQASVNLGLAALYFRFNDNVTAATYVNRAVADYTALADTGSVMMARSWRMQVNVAAGNFDSARAETNDVIRFFHREGDVTHESSLYQSLADIAIRERDWPAAKQAIDHAEALLRGHSSAGMNADLPRHRGRLALARGDLGAADVQFTRYLASLDSSEWLARSETRAYLAEIEARRGRLEQAERDLRAAGEELDAWRARLDERELRALAFQASISEANDRNNSIAWVLAMLAKGGRAASAFALAEHRRARELDERMGQAQALLSSEADSQAYRSAPRPVDGLDAPALSRKIPDSTAILEYATGAFGAPTTVFLVHKGHEGQPVIQAAILPAADSLADPIGRLVAFLESGDESPGIARSLGATLLDPILRDLDTHINHLIIIPDGPLHRLPFDVLLLPDGRPVVERFAVSTAPSASVLVDLWQRPRNFPAGGGSMLALGDPSFPTGQSGPELGQAARAAAATYHDAFASVGGVSRLEGSAHEVQRAARYVPSSEVRLRAAASAAYLKRADLTRYQIVHLATHAIVDEHAVGRTALILAPGEGETGYIGPGELAGLHLSADLVVVSACQSAGGVVVDGEGVQGLSAPLLQAGARSILATGWRISDRGTYRLIDAFYQELAQGHSVAEALRNAKLRMIQQKRPPGEWAAFTLVGDPTVRLRLRAPSDVAWYWVSLLVFGSVALGLVLWKRAARNR
jgi:CHAT domain-containing protein/tetratricopeptide (TPR) repeat protein